MSEVTEVRGDPEAIDAAWLTSVLEAGGIARGARLDDVRVGDHIGTGQMGRNVRFHLTWDEPDGRPETLVAKFPTTEPVVRANGFGNGTYIKEYVFYDQLQPTVDVRTPRSYAAVWDDDVPDFVLLMEDMAGSAQGDQFDGLTPDQAALVVEQAVALHAPRWGDDSLTTLLGRSSEETAELLTALYTGTLEGSLLRLDEWLDQEDIDLARELTPLVGRWSLGRDTPSTLVHMDFRPDNFLFGVTPDAPPLAVVDWQTISYANGTNDLAYAIGGGFEPEQRAEVERDLVVDYCDRLRVAGIDYSFDDCWRDYCQNSVWGVVMSVIATMLAEETERGNAMLATMLRRAARHAIDLDALALLEDDDR